VTTLVTDDYLELCSVLRGLTGLDLAQYKRPQMERRIRSFYAAKGVHTLTDAFHRLRTDPAHLDELLDRITINVSQLWRNPEQWRVIQDQLLPELAKRGQLRAWSAGSSYGAEAYSLAALCHALIPGVRTMITGTDIDRRVVDRARLGQFSDDDARSAPVDLLERGFDRIEGGWRAKLELRAITRFDVDDLLRVRPRTASFDLVLCRNTVIYFAEPIRDELHARLAGALRPGGFLVIGSTERVSAPASLGLTVQHPFIYRKG
jgi:chemotaxis protein methyltransferase CheR